ncbi:unnamed protein product, partial [Brenthis ino]
MEFEKTAELTLKRFEAEHIEQKKRNDYIDWVDYFMGIAFLAAKRSKDPKFQVGACIVNKNNVIVSIGYNGMPQGHDKIFPWTKLDSTNGDSLYNKLLYVCHAELNAITNRNSADLGDCTLYVTLFPCNECAKLIIQSGIKEVVYFSNKKSHKTEFIASRVMFKATGVNYWQYKPKQDKIEIIFPESDYTDDETVVDEDIEAEAKLMNKLKLSN